MGNGRMVKKILSWKLVNWKLNNRSSVKEKSVPSLQDGGIEASARSYWFGPILFDPGVSAFATQTMGNPN